MFALHFGMPRSATVGGDGDGDEDDVFTGDDDVMCNE